MGISKSNIGHNPILIGNILLPEPEQKRVLNKINRLRILQQAALHKNTNIAHAGGGYKQLTYTNTLEAMTHSVKRGFSLIELDFSWTADGELVCLSDWKETFTKLYGKTLSTPLDLAAFKNLTTVQGNLSPCTLRSLIEWLDTHPNIRIVTNIKTDNLSALKKIAEATVKYNKYFIPQIYSMASYAKVKELGYQDIIFSLYFSTLENSELIRQVDGKHLFAITMPVSRVQSGLAVGFVDLGYTAYTHAINNEQDVKKLSDYFEVYNIYTDFLPP